jgi:hypothetical protein
MTFPKKHFTIVFIPAFGIVILVPGAGEESVLLLLLPTAFGLTQF